MQVREAWRRYLGPAVEPYLSADESWAEPIVDGLDWFERIYQAIEGCTGPDHCIYLAGWAMGHDFNFRPNDSRTALARVLADKAAAGVDVRVLLYMNYLLHRDPAENSAPPWVQAIWRSEDANRARAAAQGWGADVNLRTADELRQQTARGMRPLQGRVILDYSNEIIIGTHHMKMACIYRAQSPRLVTFCGGIDFANEKMARRYHDRPAIDLQPRPTDPQPNYIGWPSMNHWHDVGVVVTGPAARGVWDTFGLRWSEAVAAEGQEQRQFTPWFSPPGTAPRRFNPSISPGPTIRQTSSLTVENITRAGSSPELQVVRTVRSFHAVRRYWPRRAAWSSPELARGLTEFASTLTRALRAARRYIYIEDQDPFLTFALSAAQDQQIAAMYQWAVGRGFLPDVDIVRPYQPWVTAMEEAIRESPDLKIIFVTKGAVSDVLGEAPNRVRPQLAAFARAHPQNVAVLLLQRYFPHAKVVLIDDYFFSVGSANFSTRSALGLDTECSVIAVAGDRDDRQPNTPKRLHLTLWSEHLRRDLSTAAREFSDIATAIGTLVPQWSRGSSLRLDFGQLGILHAFPASLGSRVAPSAERPPT